jgi:DUF1680 family protein
MNTQKQTAAIILRALREQIDPTVDAAEAIQAEQGYASCYTQTVKAGAAKAEQFAADIAEYVLHHNRRAAMRAKHTPGSEYYRYMTERMDEIRCAIFAWTSGDSDIVTACGYGIVPVAQAIERLLAE